MFRSMRLWAAILSLTLGLSFSVHAQQPVTPDGPHVVYNGVYTKDRLWAAANDGVLMSMPLNGAQPAGEARVEPLSESVYQICRDNGNAVILTGPRDHPSELTVNRYLDGHWVAQARFDIASDDHVKDMACGAAGMVVLTAQKIVDIDGPSVASHNLSGGSAALRRVATTLVTPDYLFVAVSAGEWGGGLHRIDRKTGTVEPLENKGTELCSGLLNASCHPVTGLALSPWKPDCILATVGLAHLTLSDGWVLQVCDRTITKIFEDPIPDAASAFPGTMPLWDITATQTRVIAQGWKTLYRIKPDGTAERAPIPELQSNGLFRYSLAASDLVFVGTATATDAIMVAR